MESSYEKFCNERKLVFFGRITASVTHEINNVLAIVRELAGLLDDMRIGAGEGGQVNPDKLQSISERITSQTKRGELIIKRLNRFAHGVDCPVKAVNLKNLMQDITDLCQRFASLKNIRIKTSFPEEKFELTSNPYLLQFVVFMCIDLTMSAAGEYEAIEVAFKENDVGAHISITGPPVNRDEQFIAETTVIGHLLGELEGKVDTGEAEDGRHQFALHIPHKIK